MFEQISKHTGQITLNRPKALNSFNYELIKDLEKALESAKESKSLKVLIFTGEGDRAFSAGADLKERANMSDDDTRLFLEKLNNLFDKIESFRCPTIAFINNIAFGGGLELALACDIRIAHPRALLGLTECSLGVIPGAGGTHRLPNIINKGKAFELIFSAAKLDVKQALEIGLINQIASSPDKLVEQISKCSRASLIMAKQALNTGNELGCYEQILASPDRLEGLKAFAEKRKPIFDS